MIHPACSLALLAACAATGGEQPRDTGAPPDTGQDEAAPSVVVSPVAWDAGDVAIGCEVTQTFEIIMPAGATVLDVVVVDERLDNQSFYLLDGSGSQVAVQFCPQMAGDFEDRLAVQVDVGQDAPGQDVRVDLEAHGYAADPDEVACAWQYSGSIPPCPDY